MGKRKMSPEDKLLKAIWGDKYKTQDEIDAQIETDVNALVEKEKNMSDEEFKATFGFTREEEKARTKRWMDDIHWFDCIVKYELDNNKVTKKSYGLRDVAEMVRFFYFAGRRHQAEGLDFDFSGNEVPAAEGWEAKRHNDEKA